MELARFICPPRNSPYYVLRVYHSFRQTLDVAERFMNRAATDDYRSRLDELEMVFKDELGDHPELVDAIMPFPEFVSRLHRIAKRD